MSSSSRLTSAVALLFVTLLFFTVSAIPSIPSVSSDQPLFHFCSSTDGNFTAKGPYERNLNNLAALLSYQAPPTGFGRGSAGQYPEEAFGLALCRGDVSQPDCGSCVVEAAGEIRRRCPYNKGAIIWYDNCLVKYSSSNFFGKIDNQNRFYMYNLRNVSDPTSFNAETKSLLAKLAGEAVSNKKLYAVGQTVIAGESKKLYGLTQCTRDLNPETCKTCLDGIISELPRCCDGSQGGRVVGGSCNFRYEIYPFVNTA